MTLDEKSGMKELDGWIEQVRDDVIVSVETIESFIPDKVSAL